MSDPPKRGRPPIEDEPRSAKLVTRCTPTAREQWREAAEISDESLSDIVRNHLDAWADRVLTG